MKKRKDIAVNKPQDIASGSAKGIAGLPDNQKALLQTLSVIGRPAMPALLSVVTGIPETEVTNHLAELTATRALQRRVKKRRRVYSFHDEDVEKTFYNSMSPNHRRRLHAAAARALEKEYGKEAHLHCEELARHYIEAQSKNKAVRYGLPAAESLRKKHLNEKAAETYKAVLNLLPATGRQNTKVHALIGLADVMFILGQPRAAVSHLKTALKTPGGGIPKKVEAQIWLELANYLRFQSKNREAEKCSERGLDIAPRQDLALRANLLATLASARVLTTGEHSVMNLCEDALKLAEQSGNKLEIASVLVNSGEVSLCLGESENAVKQFEKVLELSKGMSNPQPLTRCYNNISIVYWMAGRPVETIKWLEKCIALAQKTGNILHKAFALLNLANACIDAAQYDKGFRCATEAISLMDSMNLGDTYPSALTYGVLGILLSKLGQKNNAINAWKKAAALCEPSESHIKQSLALEAFADIAELQGDIDSALRHIRKAVRITAKPDLYERLFKLSLLLIRKGEFAEAVQVADRLNKVARESGSHAFGIRATWLKAMIGAESADDTDKAAAALAEVIKMLDGQRAPELQWRACHRLGQLYVSANQPEKALENLCKATQVIAGIRRHIPEEYRRTYMRLEGRDTVFEEMAELERKLGREVPSERFGALLKTINLVSMERDIDNLLDSVTEVAMHLTGADRGCLILARDGRLDFKSARAADGRTLPKRGLKTGLSIAKEVIEIGRPILSANSASDTAIRDIIGTAKTSLRSILCVPLKTPDKSLGAMYLENRYQTGAFTPDDLHLIEAFADQAAIAIENARLHAENLAQHKQLAEFNRQLKKSLKERTRQMKILLAERGSLAERTNFAGLTGRSKSMQDIYHLIEKVADHGLPVLIYGESGTGKELVARAIHFTGTRKDKPFIAENCAALPESLLESELFGYMKGAFTGADRDKKGLFELAHEGTLFLDEIGDMSAGMQAKLLRVLQDGQFRPIGGKEPVRVNVRILTASNRNLSALAEEGKFREDLFYRLNVINITMPPLRDRKEDIPLLVETLAGEVAKREKAKPMKFVTDAMRRLLLHNWPGNVRELRNVIEKIFVVTSGKVVSEADVEMSLPTGQSTLEVVGVPVELGFKGACEQFSRDYLVRLLREAKGNVTRAAAAGKITRQHMHYFLRKYSINPSRPTGKPRKTNSE